MTVDAAVSLRAQDMEVDRDHLVGRKEDIEGAHAQDQSVLGGRSRDDLEEDEDSTDDAI